MLPECSPVEPVKIKPTLCVEISLLYMYQISSCWTQQKDKNDPNIQTDKNPLWHGRHVHFSQTHFLFIFFRVRYLIRFHKCHNVGRQCVTVQRIFSSFLSYFFSNIGWLLRPGLLNQRAYMRLKLQTDLLILRVI